MAIDGARTLGSGLWAHESGDGPLVVLVHGAMDRSGGMLRARRILARDHRVVRYDRRGYGRSRAATPSADFGVQVDDLAEVLDGRPAVVAGHSFGGILGLALAERSPALVRAVLAYEAPLVWEPWWPNGGSTGVDESPEDAAEWFLRRMIG
ncbi:MAG TPA: alpha/beta hydrolase, partial [Acidimicrobiales bacterium]